MHRLLPFLFLLLSACGAAPDAGRDAGGALRVVVSVLPLKYIAERVGGDHVQVRTLVQPGQSPATYDPTPRQMAAVAEADVYVRVGVPFERAWLGRIRAANPRLRIVDAREGLDLLPAPAGGEAPDPHVWTDPLRVKRIAFHLRDVFSALDPPHAADYRANAARLAAELDALDAEIRQRLAGLKARRFLVFHPAWGYFAARYGLQQIAVQREGKSPGAHRLGELIAQARRLGIRTVFVQREFSRRDAEAVARAIGGRVVALDPLAYDLIDNLRRVAAALAEGAA